jgi:hypothetical protein
VVQFSPALGGGVYHEPSPLQTAPDVAQTVVVLGERQPGPVRVGVVRGLTIANLERWIRRGHSGGLDLAEHKVVMVGSYDEPGSPWTVALFVDDEADAAQQTALADIFLGRAGGTPSRNYSPAIQNVASVGTAVVRLDHNRRHWRIRVDGRVDVAADEEVDSDEEVACGIPGLDQPGQEVRTTTLQAAVDPLVWEWSDRCGFATNFAYRADR